jgi:hypothetical protein
MIEKTDNNEYELICDICGDSIVGFDNFSEAVGYKKQEGWKSQKHNGEWEDVCPNCQ